MTPRSFHGKPARLTAALALAGMTTLALSGCAGTADAASAAGGSGAGRTAIVIGTTDSVTALDPAAAYDSGSFTVMSQVYPFLLTTKPGSTTIEPDIAASAKFTSPTEYTVTLKKGLSFANGHALSSSDVKFSFARQQKINSPHGPAALLSNLASIETPDDLTVVFTLKKADTAFPQLLIGPAAPIVDEQVFTPDAITSDADILKGKAFAGPYTLTAYDPQGIVSYAANADYQGQPLPKTPSIKVKHYADVANLTRDLERGGIDIAWHSLSPADTTRLSAVKGLKVAHAATTSQAPLPLLQDGQGAVSAADITGVEKALSFPARYASLARQ